MRLLVIEDYIPLQRSLKKGLCEAGYAVDVVGDGEEGLAYAESDTYDVILLDVMLPKLDGYTVLKRLRAGRNHARVLMLTAKDALEDRVTGLDLGADDYVVKPFAFEELLARIRVLVRRRYRRSATTITVGDLSVDTTARVVKRAGEEIDLTATEYNILEVLAHRIGHIVTRDEICDSIYNFEAERGSNVIDVYVGYLRKKLEAGGKPRLIHTKRGLGYVLKDEG